MSPNIIAPCTVRLGEWTGYGMREVITRKPALRKGG
jgi:hypothetical protein